MNIYLNGMNNVTLKGFNVYSNVLQEDNTTPLGSHHTFHEIFYIHIIPSGLVGVLDDVTTRLSNVFQNILNEMNNVTPKEFNVYSNVLEEDNTTPLGSHLYINQIFYTHTIPSGLANFI